MVLADDSGRRLTPSVVHYPAGSNTAPLVGIEAKRSAHLHPASTFASIKRFMGRRSSEVHESEIKSAPWKFILDGNHPLRVETPQGPRLPEEISAEILKKLVAVASHRLETEITRAVITVPAYFNDAQRQATQRAGEEAGLTVERIINEPTAAALAYGIDKSHTDARVAVFDLGGGTFDISILHLTEGVFQVLSTSGDTQLGGDDIDSAIIAWLLGEVRGAAGDLTLSAEQMRRIRDAAEEAKIRLSTSESAGIILPFLTPELSFETTLSRENLESMAMPVVRRTRNHCLRALRDAGLEPADLDQVILVGGQTRMPMVRTFVKELFACQDFGESRGSLRVGVDPHRADGPVLNTGTDPDEAVALGAAIQGAILSGALKNVVLMDVTPLSLGIETFGGLMNVIIPRNTTIPVKAGEMFTNAVDFQKSMLIRVLQGEREKAADNWELGQLTIEFEPLPRATARVGVQFEIDSNGVLHVLARDTRTGKDQIVEIRSAVDVEDEAVQQMVESSVEHAFSDLAHRRWVEAKQRARETIDATRAGLEAYGNQLDESERAPIEQALDSTLKALESEDPDTGTGDTALLKSSLASLDDASSALAEIMMEALSEEFLRSRGLIQ